MSERIHLSRADVGEAEERMVLEALRSGWVAPLGPMVDRFEVEMAQRSGVAHAVALSSGTAALHLALQEVGARPGRVVLVPSLTFAASANAVAYTGATPVFLDALAQDGNVDPDLLLAAVDTLRQEGADIAAVMTVDLFGRCADYQRILAPLAERGIPVVEDAAEALGASYAGRPAGGFGAAAALSFNGNKILTTSGGGMLLTDDPQLATRVRYLSTQARQPVPWYEHTDVGYNYRMSNILAALGVAQLSRLDAMMARRRAHRERYAAAFSAPGMRILGRGGARPDDADNCWLTCLVVDGCDTDAVIAEVGARQIEARHLWKPMHLQPVFAQARAFVTGASEQLFRSSIVLPSGSELRDEQIDRVIDAVHAALSR